jgi:hypothetical protein
MAAGVKSSGESKEPRNETETHARLKRLAFLWAQAQGFLHARWK